MCASDLSPSKIAKIQVDKEICVPFIQGINITYEFFLTFVGNAVAEYVKSDGFVGVNHTRHGGNPPYGACRCHHRPLQVDRFFMNSIIFILIRKSAFSVFLFFVVMSEGM